MSQITTKTNDKKLSFIWLISVFFVAVSLLLFCQFFFDDTVNENTTFYDNTFVNGVEISGLTKAEAENKLENDLLQNKEKINITLKSNEKEWTLNGNDFDIKGNYLATLDDTLSYQRKGNIFQKQVTKNKIQKNSLNIIVPYQDLLSSNSSSIDDIISNVEIEPTKAQLVFNPNDEISFTTSKAQIGYKVDRDLLNQYLFAAIDNNNDIVEIPLKEIVPETDKEDYRNNITLRSKFSTNYQKSSSDRKSNIKKALGSFNGMIVEPGQEVSFNKTTGPRNSENGYKNAKIILNGNYTPGVGGGVCQASTTLYNALLLAGVEIKEVNHHSLPASYVPLSFDAMVSEDLADLVFANNLETPIYIKTYCDDALATVEIYGMPFEDGVQIKTRSELVKVLPHGGDDIIKDTDGAYSDKVLYKGEYYRLKYPQEGYESKGFIQTLKDGVVIEEKEIRHDRYSSQKGVIVEGTFSLEEGMSLPENNVRYIAPQKVTKDTLENAKKKLKLNQ